MRRQRISIIELKNAIKAVKEMDLPICELSFDDNGRPIIKTVNTTSTSLDNEKTPEQLHAEWEKEHGSAH